MGFGLGFGLGFGFGFGLGFGSGGIVPDRMPVSEKWLTATPARCPLNISNPNPTLVRYHDGDSQPSAMASRKNGFSARFALVTSRGAMNAM